MRIYLPRNGALKIRGGGRGMVISCAEGIVWVTQPSDITDYFLSPRERFVVERSGVVMVEACRDAWITITGSGAEAPHG